jgi:hypothetical protein
MNGLEEATAGSWCLGGPYELHEIGERLGACVVAAAGWLLAPQWLRSALIHQSLDGTDSACFIRRVLDLRHESAKHGVH